MAVCPTQRSQHTDRVLSEKMMARYLDGVLPTGGSRRVCRSFLWLKVVSVKAE
jgi:hypothetical protein